jgi:hypothetical protein
MNDKIADALSLASSEQLVDELFRRYPEAFFGGVKMDHQDPERALYYQRFQGHSVVTQGMAMRIIRKIQDTEDYPEGSEEDL